MFRGLVDVRTIALIFTIVMTPKPRPSENSYVTPFCTLRVLDGFLSNVEEIVSCSHSSTYFPIARVGAPENSRQATS